MNIPPNAIYRFNEITTKISMSFFKKLGKTILKFTYNKKKARIVKSNSKLKE